MAKVKKSKKEIKEDSDGTFYCSDCGKAGFKGYMNGLAHLRHCRGFEAVSQEIDEEYKQLNNSILSMVGHTQSRLDNQSDTGSHTPPSVSALFGNKHARTHAEARSLRSQPATAGSHAESHAEKGKTSANEKVLMAKLEASNKMNDKLHKYAFNHVQHATPNRNKITNANDLLMSGINDLAQNVWFQRLIAIGAMVWVFSWIKENLEKLEKKSSNNGSKKKK